MTSRGSGQAGADVTGSPTWTREAFTVAASLLDTFTRERAGANLMLIERVADLLAAGFSRGNKVLICGNGGSSADAMHFAEELTGRFRKERPALPAIACTDPGHITCVGNDYGYDRVFSRFVEALGAKGDTLIVLSTSGNSANVKLAVDAAKAKSMTTVSLLGKTGGSLKGMCDHEWIVGDGQSALPADRIQEIHMLVLHTLIEGIERRLFPENYR